MYIVVFLTPQGTQAHACATAEIRQSVIEDVCHHADEHIHAFRGHNGTDWDIAVSRVPYADDEQVAYLIPELPETARIELM